eukprot:3041028-Prymnesium_polylepis.1
MLPRGSGVGTSSRRACRSGSSVRQRACAATSCRRRYRQASRRGFGRDGGSPPVCATPGYHRNAPGLKPGFARRAFDVGRAWLKTLVHGKSPRATMFERATDA